MRNTSAMAHSLFTTHRHNLRSTGLEPALIFGLLLLAVILWHPHQGHAGGPAPGQTALDPEGNMHIADTDRCPVCAMLPARYPRFAAAIQLQDGRTYYFCSPGCMLNAWLNPEIFLETNTEALKRPVALEYLDGHTVDARKVFWVSGSDVVGPMGPALIPLKDSTHLQAFRSRHGGEHIFRLEELNHGNWEALTGKRPAGR